MAVRKKKQTEMCVIYLWTWAGKETVLKMPIDQLYCFFLSYLMLCFLPLPDAN